MNVGVTPPSIVLEDPLGTHVRGKNNFVDLSWTGSLNVDIKLYGNVVSTITGANSYSDNIGKNPSGTYTYQVCEAGSDTACSEEVAIIFP